MDFFNNMYEHKNVHKNKNKNVHVHKNYSRLDTNKIKYILEIVKTYQLIN